MPSDGATGAKIELCRTRACDGKVIRADVSASEYTPSERLDPGFWFWRVYTTKDDAYGTTPSPVWEVFVRDGTQLGTNGAIVDVNGDGRVDLIASVGAERAVLLGTNDDGTAFDAEHAVRFAAQPGDVAAGLDLDGDGFGDIAFDSSTSHELKMLSGSANGVNLERVLPVFLPPLDGVPIVRSIGDPDGDGYGDLVVTTATTVYAVDGTSRGPGTFSYLAQGSGLTVPMPAVGAFDGDGDGLSDMIFSNPKLTVIVLYGQPSPAPFKRFNPSTRGEQPTNVTALVAGDFDGDGLSDTAFAATRAGKASVCVLGAKEKENGANIFCVEAPTGAMIAADLDADGRDEILLATATNIDVLRLSGAALTRDPVTRDYGAPLALILPGRPGPAVWAASRAGKVALFRGTQTVGTVF
jgi:hypothetical protein